MTQAITTPSITSGEFESSVLHADKPVLVDFYADWCGPCKALSPVLEQLADEYAGRIEVVKIDIDANPETAANYQVRSLPTLALFDNGQMVKTSVGVQPKAKLSALIEGYIN